MYRVAQRLSFNLVRQYRYFTTDTAMGGGKLAGPTNTTQQLSALRDLMKQDPKVDA
jgi:hypothetical protein